MKGFVFHVLICVRLGYLNLTSPMKNFVSSSPLVRILLKYNRHFLQNKFNFTVPIVLGRRHNLFCTCLFREPAPPFDHLLPWRGDPLHDVRVIHRASGMPGPWDDRSKNNTWICNIWMIWLRDWQQFLKTEFIFSSSNDEDTFFLHLLHLKR